jgi:hypothetical protein
MKTWMYRFPKSMLSETIKINKQTINICEDQILLLNGTRTIKKTISKQCNKFKKNEINFGCFRIENPRL